MGIFDFELFNAGHMAKQAIKNPDQLLVGAADPFGAKLWSGITGKDYEPIVNEWGGASDGAYKAAEAKGINTGAAKGAHQVAQAIAGIFAGGALGGAMGGGAGAASGNAAQGLSMGGGTGLTAGSGAGLSSMGGGTGLTGAGANIGYSGATTSGGGLLSSSNLKTANDMMGLAAKAGVFDQGQQSPQAQSAGLPARQADFTGLLSANRINQMSGAEKLIAQRAARRG